MTRHKSRVARRSRRSARRGTRKQSGGFNFFGLFGSEPAGAAPAGEAPPAPAPAASFWDKFNPFKSKNPEPEVVSNAAETTGSPPKLPAQIPAAANDSAATGMVGGRKKSRKTRHRRRRSPRHHRK
jgi:hypothetical protein